jgi:predicted lactoylglutathione lyase
MPRMIFVNLPVADLGRSIDFYKAIGAEQNMQFSDETAACMVFSDAIHVMLLTHDKFRQFTSKRIPDAHETAQMLLALSADSRAGVDEITNNALAGGGREARPTEDYGWMYCRPFEDPDGHTWEPMWMDVEAANAAMAELTA